MREGGSKRAGSTQAQPAKGRWHASSLSLQRLMSNDKLEVARTKPVTKRVARGGLRKVERGAAGRQPVAPGRALQMMEEGRHKVSTGEEEVLTPSMVPREVQGLDTETGIPFGSGWEGDVEGYRRVVRVIRNDSDMPAADDQQEYRREHRGELSTREAPRDATQEIGARDQSCGSARDIECKQPGRGSYAGGVVEQNHAEPVRTLRKRDEAHTDRPDGRRENNPDPNVQNVSGEESDKQNHKVGHCAMKHNGIHVANRARNGVEEKKRETII